MDRVFFGRFTVARLLGIITALVIIVVLYLVNLRNYLLFHTLIELFIITVALATFLLAWNARRFFTSNHLLFLSISFLFNAILELLHTLAYKGMNLFDGITTNEPTELWIATGYLKAISFLVLPFIPRRKLPLIPILIAYSGITLILILSIFVWKSFPDCYIEGKGLTDFKVISEILIAVSLGVAMLFLHRIRGSISRKVLNFLQWSIGLNIAAELAFIFYIDVYGTLNMFGHYFLLMSYYLIYKAIIETGLKNPLELLFRDLEESREELRDYANKLEDINETLEHEIAERKAAEETVTRYLKELEELNKQKNRLFSVISHDLRNPFVGLLSLSKALAEKPQELSKQQVQDYSSLLHSSAKTLYSFINSLLKWANIQTGKMSYNPVKLNLCQAVSGMLNMVQGNILTKQIKVVNTLNDDLNVYTDENFLTSILENLMSNAIKFSNAGGVIELSAEKKDKFIEISIKDYGVGIHPDDLKKLFKLDQGFSTTGTMREEGAGLGLILCKDMVQKAGGEIWVESTEGEGSNFHFTVLNADRAE